MRTDFTHTFKERYITPTLNYKRQGPFEQLDMGAYVYMEPLIFGVWYRGLPYKPVENQSNRDAVVMLVGVNLPSGLNIGYSFDYTISKLGPGSGGAHEFSLVYTWPMRNPRKPPKDKLIIPCPDF